MNKILVTLLALIGGSCISFAQMETGRVSDTAEDTLRIENEIVAVDTGFYQSVVRYDTVRYNLKMQSVYKKAFQLKNDVFVEKMKEPWLDDILRNILFKMDSNHRRRKPADLQSAPFGHSGICPFALKILSQFSH